MLAGRGAGVYDGGIVKGGTAMMGGVCGFEEGEGRKGNVRYAMG